MVIELHYIFAAAVIAVQRMVCNLIMAELFIYLIVKNIPVRTPPTVNALFHISHYKVLHTAVQTVLQQGIKILPLQG